MDTGDPGQGTSSLVRADVKDVGWALQEGSCFFTGSQLVYSPDAANPSSFFFPPLPIPRKFECDGQSGGTLHKADILNLS